MENAKTESTKKKTQTTKKTTTTSTKKSVSKTPSKTKATSTKKSVSKTPSKTKATSTKKSASKTPSKTTNKNTKSTTTKKVVENKNENKIENEQIIETNYQEIKREKKVIEKASNQSFTLLIILMLIAIVILLASSYGFFAYQRSGKKPNILYTADLSIILDETASLGINHQNAFPVYDEVGRTTEPYKFTLKNLGAIEANYKIRLLADTDAQFEDGCASNLLAEESIKFQLIKDGIVAKEDVIANLEDYVIDVGFIGTEENNKSYDYELRLWISSLAGKEVMGRHYHGKIEVEVIDPTNS